MTQNTETTIQRPDGTVEKVLRAGVMPLKMRKAAEDATRQAGRGEIIAWRVVEDNRPKVNMYRLLARDSYATPSNRCDGSCGLGQAECAKRHN